MDDINFKELLVRKPFIRPIPDGYQKFGITSIDMMDPEPDDTLVGMIVTQSDFMREYYPSSHAINDREKYPDVLKKDPETGKWYRQPVTRCSFAFQQIIAIKQIIHICGNDIQMELSSKSSSDSEEKKDVETLYKLRLGWLKKNMEIRFYESVRSIKITGDTAFVGYKDGKNFGSKVFSFISGDKLYPHIDSITGKLTAFARKYKDYDENGNIITEWVEVWDDKYIYRAKRSGKRSGISGYIAKVFGLSGYSIISKKPHGFNFVPVAYFRDDNGACWSNSQDTIEKYEEAFSYFCENNKAFAFPIMYFKGEDVDIHGDLNGSVKSIPMGTEDDAGFLDHQDVSTAFNTELNSLYKAIYEQSFAVIPPELKSGDLPGVAIKLLYSPAIEKAILDANALQGFLDDMVNIFKHGYGWEIGAEADIVNLDLNVWIEPYIHQNITELVTNLATAVQNKFLSHQTASERISMYSKNDEFDRILREKKEEQSMDLLMELKKQDNETKNNIKEQEEQQKLQQKNQSGQDVNTGRGGRPNRSGRVYDENRNWLGRDNWDNE